MQIVLKIKIGPFLVISSVLALWTLLAARPVQAHDSTVRLPIPSCGNLPESTFLATPIAITAATLTDADGTNDATTRGGGVTGRGDNKFRYARITIPALAAGELRVSDAATAGPSDAVLCRGSSPLVNSITSYTAHNTALAAAARADDGDAATTTDQAAKATAAGIAATAAASETVLGTARSALSRARSALNTARSNLNAAVRALNAANATGASITEATDAEQAALTAYNAAVLPSSSMADADELADVQGKLGPAGTALGAAGTALTAASTALTAAATAMHMGFQIRAPVSPGDQEYIVVVSSEDPTSDLAVNVQFHGAIDIATSPASITGALRAGGAPEYTLHISAPGLLTLETTGNTDTIGTLDDSDGAEVAQAESGGSGDNFKIVVPVPANTAPTEGYKATVQGQTSTTTGSYTLGMDFQVAMTATITGITDTQVDVADAPTWTGTGVPADDTTLQIQPSTDEDYFLLTVGADSGFLTVEANNDATTARDADTRGTLFGAMGEGPMGEMRTGQIAMDADSGPTPHFGFTVPVEAGKHYLLKVEGTAGVYVLQGAFAAAEDHDGDPDTDTITPPADAISDTLTASTGTTQNAFRYLLSIEESGTLYLHTTGTTDVTGTLYGPDGRRVARDEDSGNGNNFRIAVNVGPGLYILEVKGAARSTAGPYSLVTNFVAGAGGPVTPGTPGTGDDEVTRLRNQITTLQNQLAECQGGVTTDVRGSLDDPNSDGANTGYRSGVGLIRGWVCAANAVEVLIFDDEEEVVATVSTPYGSARPDTALTCEDSNNGFAAQYNYNHLPEGEYTARAYADGRQIGVDRTFEVVHLTGFARTDRDRFLRDLPAGTCDVEDFPEDGDATRLRWEESLQNFVIEDAG